MKEYKITKEKILAMASECSEAKTVLKKGFPEAFKKEDEWVEKLVDEMNLQRRKDEREGEIGVVILPDDYYMPYNVEFTDIWEGDRCNGNPMTGLYVYKLENGRIYRRKR